MVLSDLSQIFSCILACVNNFYVFHSEINTCSGRWLYIKMDGAFWFQEGSQRGGAKNQHPIIWLQKVSTGSNVLVV